MAQFDPMYGELLTSREVANLTGFSMNQLRYFRQVPEKSQIPFIQQGSTTLYRKDDIYKWIELNGRKQLKYVVPEGFEPAPLLNPGYEASRKEDFDKLAKITTRNCWTTWATYVTERAGIPTAEAYKRIEIERTRMHEIATGENLRDLYPEIGDFNMMRKNDPLRFWPSYTWAIRRIVADVQNIEISDKEIIDLPIGENPPSKIDGFN